MTTEQESVREAIARIIDPAAFIKFVEYQKTRQREALAKADAILDRIDSTPTASGELVIDPQPELAGSALCKVMSYNWAHEDAVRMGYPSLTEALEHLDELRAAQPPASPDDALIADELTGCTMPELLERLPTAERLATIAEQLDRLVKICNLSKKCMTPEGGASKAIVYAFMESAIDDASFAALALRQLLPAIRALDLKGAETREDQERRFERLAMKAGWSGGPIPYPVALEIAIAFATPPAKDHDRG